MSLRTKSREFAMQMLFQWDMSKQDLTKLEGKFWKGAKAAEPTRNFANQLFEGAAHDSMPLDELISQARGQLAAGAACGHRPRHPEAGAARNARHGHSTEGGHQ